MSAANIQAVRAAMDRFLAEDIPGFIQHLSPDVRWDHRGPEGIPFNRIFEGREDMGEFFRLVYETLDMVKFDVKEYLGDGDRVVTLGTFAWKVKATNKTWEVDFAFVQTMRDGLIAEWKPLFDMSKMAAAFEV